MKPADRKVHFRTGDQINPDDIARAEESTIAGLERSMEYRYFHSFFSIPMTGLVDTDSANMRTIQFKANSAFRITAIEMHVKSSSATSMTHTLAVDDFTGTAITAAAATVATASTTLTSATTDTDIFIPSDTGVKFTWSSSAACTLTYANFIIHIVADRVDCRTQGPLPSSITLQNPKSGDTLQAANYSGAAADYDADALVNNEMERAVCILVVPGARATTLADGAGTGWCSLPAAKMGVHYVSASVTHTVPTDLTWSVRNQANSSQAGAVLTWSSGITMGYSDGYGSVGQTTFDPDDLADDWAVKMSTDLAANRCCLTIAFY